MSATLHAAPTVPGEDRSHDLAIARLHLRLGSLGLARAELEGMAGSGALDCEGLVDLAEARWRTGDLAGAGEAAGAALTAGSEAVVAYVISAEATAAVGRPAEARRLASRALELADLSVSEVFAGMPRASVWPIEPSDTTTTEPLFGTTPTSSFAGASRFDAASAAARGLWDDHGDGLADLPDPATLIQHGRAALDAGDPARAGLHLGVALRLAPALAPVVLQLLDGQDGPELALVRGDAYRLAGHERDARLAFAAAVDGSTTSPPIEATKETS